MLQRVTAAWFVASVEPRRWPSSLAGRVRRPRAAGPNRRPPHDLVSRYCAARRPAACSRREEAGGLTAIEDLPRSRVRLDAHCKPPGDKMGRYRADVIGAWDALFSADELDIAPQRVPGGVIANRDIQRRPATCDG